MRAAGLGGALAGAALAVAACVPPPSPLRATAGPEPPPSIAPSAPPRRGPLDSAFLVLDGAPADPVAGRARVRAELEDLDALGVGMVVIASTRARVGPGCAGAAFAWLPGFPERLGLVLEEANRLDMQVVVGLVANSPACTAFDDPAVAAATRVETERALVALAPWLDAPALVGLYLPDEPGLGWESTYVHYAGLVRAVRAASRKPVAVSPFLARSTERWSPAEVAGIAARFQRATGVDVEIWQDSVGVDGVDLGWGRPGGRGRVGDYLRAIAGALGREHVWADIELFDCCGPPLTPAAMTRIAAQIAAAGDALVARRVAWLPQRQMGRVDPERRPEAGRLRAAFAARTGRGGARVQPTSYAWMTPPSFHYPDRGGALFDGRTGDPRRFEDTAWVGVLGSAAVRVTLAPGTRVDWIGVHSLRAPRAGIELADRLVVRCQSDGRRFVLAPAADARARQGEYVIGNIAPLGAVCDALDISLLNPGRWTFVSEIEIVAGLR